MRSLAKADRYSSLFTLDGRSRWMTPVEEEEKRLLLLLVVVEVVVLLMCLPRQAKVSGRVGVATRRQSRVRLGIGFVALN